VITFKSSSISNFLFKEDDAGVVFVPTSLIFSLDSLNFWADQGKAVVLDGPFKLDPSWRYLVDSMILKIATRIVNIFVGLFAHFGPYIVQISALFLGNGCRKNIPY